MLYNAVSGFDWTATTVVCFAGKAVVGRSHARTAGAPIIFGLQVVVTALEIVVVAPLIVAVAVTLLARISGADGSMVKTFSCPAIVDHTVSWFHAARVIVTLFTWKACEWRSRADTI